MGRPFPTLETTAPIGAAYKLLTLANAAILVTEGARPIGVVTRQDVIGFLSTSSVLPETLS
jgi:predicted transcriptional regulator